MRKFSRHISVTSIISRTETMRYLGLIIDENLKWDKHTKKLKQQITSLMYAINRNKFTHNIKNILYHTHILTKITVLITAWSKTTNKNLNLIQTAQNRTIKILYNINRFEPTINVYKNRLNIQQL